MKKLISTILIMTSFLFASCDKEVKVITERKNPEPPTTVPQLYSYVGDETNDPRLAGVLLDFSNLELNTPVSISERLGCSTFLLGTTNEDVDLGIPEGTLVIESTDGLTGKLHFSHLPYVDKVEHGLLFNVMRKKHPLCSLLTTESFDFEVTNNGDVLRIFAIAPGMPWDGSENTFTKGNLETPKTEGIFAGSGTNDSRLVGVSLDLSGIPMNTPTDFTEQLGCTGYLLGSSVDIGRDAGTLTIVSSNAGKSGRLHFSHMPYVHPDEKGKLFGEMQDKNELCALFTGETYDFEVQDDELIIKAIAPGKAWDGIENSFIKD